MNNSYAISKRLMELGYHPVCATYYDVGYINMMPIDVSEINVVKAYKDDNGGYVYAGSIPAERYKGKRELEIIIDIGLSFDS